MDMRSKVYPSMPEGQGLRLVLPRTGDLRYRSHIPTAFIQRLYIHADPRRRFWYTRFQLKRKFIVMSKQGDLYVKTSVTVYTMADLPKKNVLSMPRVACGDLVKVLDLVQCSRSEGQYWELVLTRWRNNMETWLPLEVVQLSASNLLQEFYVNSVNSWAFHGRIHLGSLQTFQTEVELWLYHPEFQELYKKLRQRRVGDTTIPSTSQQQPVQVSNQTRVKLERPVASVHTSQAPLLPHMPHVTQEPVIVPVPAPVSTENDPSEIVIQEFEQRRLARVRQEQLEQTLEKIRQMKLQQELLQGQQRAREQLEQQRKLEAERQLQHERQRKKTHEELQKSQKKYLQRLRMQQEREKEAELQQHQQEQLLRVQKQEELQRRLQQAKPLQEQTPRERRSQEKMTTTQLRHKENRSDAILSPGLHRPSKSNSISIWTKDGDDEYVPPNESSESNDSHFSADSEASENSVSYRSRKRRRKRLLYSQVDLDDEDDDELPDLSQPRPSNPQRNEIRETRQDELYSRKSFQKMEKRKRLRKSFPTKENGATGSIVDVDLTQLSDDDDDNDDDVDGDDDDDDGDDNCLEVPVTAPPVTPNDHDKRESCDDDNVAAVVDEDTDDDDDEDFEPTKIVGRILCVCGATSVGGYRGQWMQCWNKECGVWEHADCVGLLTSSENQPSPRYFCTRCDPAAYLAHRVKASQRIMDWLFQCCDSRNVRQLMKLLEDNSETVNIPSDWKNVRFDNRTLAMHVARNGLAQCLQYLLDERKVDIFATDLQSRNALHHAAQGGSVTCCRVLLKHDQTLLLHPDLRGCMPFHCMLQSVKVNKLCIPLMQENTALVGMGDLDSNFPIHYACQAVNRYTVKICQIIFAAQTSMLHEKSSENLDALMILCKSAGTSTDSIRNKIGNASEVAKSAKDVISLMLDIDVFGDCLNQKAPNGWCPLHFAAASGNHELITHICNIAHFDVNHAAKASGETALHIAAQQNCSLGVRALLLEGLNVTAKDSEGRIPMLCTEDAKCIQEFMHYKLTKQLSRLHRMLGKYKQRGLVRRWQHLVVRDPTCFDILNDWCQRDTERIERMEGLLLSNPFLLRLDNKMKYVRTNVVSSIKRSSGIYSVTTKNGKTGIEKQSKRQKKLAFVFSHGNGCFWKQFVGMGMRLEPEDFRLPLIFSIDQGIENRDTTMRLVLAHLAEGLVKEVPGLLVRGSSHASEQFCLSSDKQELAGQLLGFYLLGELVAHFVLFAVHLNGKLDFNPAFLRCIGCQGKYKLEQDGPWHISGSAFVAGFEAVLPATLVLFRAEDLRVLFNGPQTSLNAMQIDWSTAIDWKICGTIAMCDKDTGSAKVWLSRLMNDLVEEEQQLLLLFMTGSFQLISRRFVCSGSDSDRLTVASFSETDDPLDYDTMLPIVDYNHDLLRLPSYSCYEAFKKGMLTVIRHADHAFLSE
ncbi:hypothetical protein KXD40_003407 [Peronospora effusa]|uniref:HECT domain-containing protein n=1 Tax=Peronospora effusa TaxID=542832 RepID=A0A3M6VCK7_9STRA|nr:hypothetical protein DD238_005134 [Peronospora effusa]UIZ29660.1 hypothetical protein KXD40_003407 [Peronospora effusa]